MHVTLYNDSNEDEGEVLGDLHKVQVSDSGDYTTSDTFDDNIYLIKEAAQW